MCVYELVDLPTLVCYIVAMVLHNIRFLECIPISYAVSYKFFQDTGSPKNLQHQ